MRAAALAEHSEGSSRRAQAGPLGRPSHVIGAQAVTIALSGVRQHACGSRAAAGGAPRPALVRRSRLICHPPPVPPPCSPSNEAAPRSLPGPAPGLQRQVSALAAAGCDGIGGKCRTMRRMLPDLSINVLPGPVPPRPCHSLLTKLHLPAPRSPQGRGQE